jgi:hypothetical protein
MQINNRQTFVRDQIMNGLQARTTLLSVFLTACSRQSLLPAS